jgi:hypothetical protein
MLSIVMAADGEERAVAATLAALVPGAAAGVVRDVVLVAREPSGLLERIADATGCALLPATGTRGAGLAAGAREARSDWLMFLTPGAIPEHGWIDEVGDFLANDALAGGGARAALFGYAASGQISLAGLAGAVRRAFFPSPDQGLIIARAHYQRLGGHAEGARDPERALIVRIPRAQRVILRTRMRRS